ncbi:MAG: hypothetical protein KBG15_11620 [Kofleriaceae bacterium]|nr:hypothetical protein [Kofleriaceae bacterium]
MKVWRHTAARIGALALIVGSVAAAVHFAAAQKRPQASTVGALGSGGAGSGVALSPAQQAITDAVAAGTYWRIDGPHGPLHVWRPAGYHADGAATILYAHGYYINVDGAWLKYQLPEQFAMSGANATFIAVEVPSGVRQAIHYPNLVEVLQIVEHATASPRGSGPIVAMGHSGAFRTLKAWMDAPMLDTIIALDALYGENDAFQEWFEGGPHRRMITVGDDTLRWTEEMATDISETFTVDMLPATYDAWPAKALSARHVYVRSQFNHMALVTSGRAIPALLRLLPVETLPTSPWQSPLGQLPPLLLGSNSSVRP